MVLTRLADMPADIIDHLAMAGRFSRDLPAFLRTVLTVEEARRRVRHQMDRRDQRFLELVDAAIYDHPRSPYLQLLRHAGCERGDIHALVAQEGIEGTLRHLADRGVYVSFDEFKGRRPVVRGSARWTFSDRDFDSPLHPWHYFEYTGGSRGEPSRVGQTLPLIADLAVLAALLLDAHGVHEPGNVFWFGASPAWPLIHLKLGHPIEAWFQPIRPLPLVARAGVRYLRFLANLAGRQVPTPRYCDLRAPEGIVHWLTRSRGSTARPTLVNSTASSAVRIAAAAATMGHSLAGVTFHCRSEPLTPARRRQIEAVDARVVADYASVELSVIAISCQSGTDADDMHLGQHRHAVVERERPLLEGGPSVSAMLFTTLSMHAPKVALNVELGDSARVEERECGCLLGELGLRTHLSEIRSFEKLSSEGTTFARSNLVQILEEILPARFGGTPIDYQLAEVESADGVARLVLRVHPRLGSVDEAAVCQTLLEAMSASSVLDAYQARLIERARAVVVERRAPLPTRAGKVLTFQLSRLGEGSA